MESNAFKRSKGSVCTILIESIKLQNGSLENNKGSAVDPPFRKTN